MSQLVCWIARQPWCQHRDWFPALGALQCPHTEHQLVSKGALTAVTDHQGCWCAKAADRAPLDSAAVLNKIIALLINTKQNPSWQWHKSPVCAVSQLEPDGGEEGTCVGSCCSREGSATPAPNRDTPLSSLHCGVCSKSKAPVLPLQRLQCFVL